MKRNWFKQYLGVCLSPAGQSSGKRPPSTCPRYHYDGPMCDGEMGEKVKSRGSFTVEKDRTGNPMVVRNRQI